MSRAVIILSLFLAALSSHAAGISGRVVEDGNGSAVASAMVQIYRPGQSLAVAESQTDREGRFAAPKLPAGLYRLDVTRQNYANATISAEFSEDVPVAVRLVRCGVLSGRVLDRQGQPMTNARVVAFVRPAEGGPLRRAAAPAVSTDDRGEYRLANLAPGQYQVAVYSNAGGMLESRRFQVSGGEDLHSDLAFRNDAEHSVAGKVLLPGPRMRFVAALTAIDEPAVALTTNTTDDFGKFLFPRVPAGSYLLLISGPRGVTGTGMEEDLYFSRTRVDVSGDDVTGVIVEAPQGRPASFELRAAAGCPAGAHVTLAALEDWGARVDRSFNFAFGKPAQVTDLAPARYRLQVSQVGQCSLVSPAVVDLTGTAGTTPIAIEIGPPGSISGRLSGEVRPGNAAVVLAPVDLPETGGWLEIAVPGADGKFAFDRLRAGHYRLGAQLMDARWLGDLDGMFDVEVIAGQPLTLDLPSPSRKAQ